MTRTTATLALLATACPAQWFPSQPSSPPAARGGAAMAHHDGTGQTVLFGGQPAGSGAFTDTYAFDGEEWTLLAPLQSPPARGSARMVFDSNRGVCVLFGGTSISPIGGASLQDTWEWNGLDWTQVTTATTPFRTGRHGLAFDRARGRIVAFGGVPSTLLLGATNQTWEYDGTNWQQRTPPLNPGPLDSPAMCWSDSLQRTVLFGGVQPVSGAASSATWLWDGSQWQTANVLSGSPSPRYGAEMVYDESRGVCVMFGGVTTAGTLLDETWEFDGLFWTLTSTGSPQARRAHSMAYDRTRLSTVLFGGSASLGGGIGSALQDTFVHGASYAPYGQPCLGSAGLPFLRAQQGPRLGFGFAATLGQLVPTAPIAIFVTGFSRTDWLGTPLPLDMTGLGLTGCTLFAAAERLDVVTAGGGFATLLLAIPNDPWFLGQSFYQQGFSFEAPGYNPFGGVLSNAARAVIGS